MVKKSPSKVPSKKQAGERPAKKPTAKKKAKGVVEITDSPIKKTNRFFLSLRSYGHCDENDKAVMKLEYGSDKWIAPADRSFAFMSVVCDKLFNCMRHSSTEAAKKDLDEFKRWANSLQIVGNERE